YEATRLRERPMLVCILLVAAANLVVFWAIAADVTTGQLDLGRAVIFAQASIGAATIAFGGLTWAMDGAAAPVAAVLRLGPAMEKIRGVCTGERAGGDPPLSADSI